MLFPIDNLSKQKLKVFYAAQSLNSTQRCEIGIQAAVPAEIQRASFLATKHL